MSFFIGIIPDEKTNYKIRKVIGDVGRVFEGQSADVRWVRPDGTHISLIKLGDNLNFIQQFFLNIKLNNIHFAKFKVILDKANVGIARSYKELIYISLYEGGEDIRNILFKMREKIKSNDANIFLPHITLGRISKDLTNEEYRNLVVDVRNVNESLGLRDIEFTVSTLHVIEYTKDGVYRIVKSYDLV